MQDQAISLQNMDSKLNQRADSQTDSQPDQQMMMNLPPDTAGSQQSTFQLNSPMQNSFQNSPMRVSNFDFDEPGIVERIKQGKYKRISYQPKQKEVNFEDQRDAFVDSTSDMEGSFIDDDDEEEKTDEKNQPQFQQKTIKPNAQISALTKELLQKKDKINFLQPKRIQSQPLKMSAIPEDVDQEIERFTVKNLKTGKTVELDQQSFENFQLEKQSTQKNRNTTQPMVHPMQKSKSVQNKALQQSSQQMNQTTPVKKKKKRSTIWGNR